MKEKSRPGHGRQGKEDGKLNFFYNIMNEIRNQQYEAFWAGEVCENAAEREVLTAQIDKASLALAKSINEIHAEQCKDASESFEFRYYHGGGAERNNADTLGIPQKRTAQGGKNRRRMENQS